MLDAGPGGTVVAFRAVAPKAKGVGRKLVTTTVKVTVGPVPTAGSISGVVTGPDGAPLADTWVGVVPKSARGTYAAQLRTNAAGAYAAARGCPGRVCRHGSGR